MIPIRKMVVIAFAFILLMGLACSAQSEGGPKEEGCKETFSSFKGLPVQVLVGTDIDDIASYKESSMLSNDKYIAEMGGAILTIQITKTDKARVLKRTYQEPGRPVSVREYSPVCIADGRFSTVHLKGKIVHGGLLLLEEQPEVDGIPNNLWIFYKGK